MSRDPSRLRVCCCGDALPKSRPIFGVDGTNLVVRCSEAEATPLSLPRSPFNVVCFSSPPRCNRVRMGCCALALSAPSLAAPPPATRRDVSPTKPNAGATNARAGIHAGGSGGRAPHHFSRPSTPPSLASRTRGSPREPAPSSIRSCRLGLPAVSRLSVSRLQEQTNTRTNERIMGVTACTMRSVCALWAI